MFGIVRSSGSEERRMSSNLQSSTPKTEESVIFYILDSKIAGPLTTSSSLDPSALDLWLQAFFSYPRTFRFQNPKIQRAGRGGAARGGAAGRGGAGHDGQTYRFAYESSVSRTRPGIGFTCGKEFFRSTNKRNLMQTGG